MSPRRRAPRPGTTRRRPLRAAALLACGLLSAGCAGDICDPSGARCVPGDTERRYAQLLDFYVVNGLLRTERAPDDAPIDRETLARNFETVAFNSEFAPGAELKEETTPTRLTRWSGPITWNVAGDAAGPADRAELAALTRRIAAATGLAFHETSTTSAGRGHILALVLSARARLALSIASPRAGDAALPLVAAWAVDDRFPCVGVILERAPLEGPAQRRGALLLIKAETAGLLRRACLHEEFTQVLGLTNDGEEIRPSIFNDDQEFALLTRHDELLLKILYDPRLKDGMSAEEARPLIRKIVADLDI